MTRTCHDGKIATLRLLLGQRASEIGNPRLGIAVAKLSDRSLATDFQAWISAFGWNDASKVHIAIPENSPVRVRHRSHTPLIGEARLGSGRVRHRLAAADKSERQNPISWDGCPSDGAAPAAKFIGLRQGEEARVTTESMRPSLQWEKRRWGKGGLREHRSLFCARKVPYELDWLGSLSPKATAVRESRCLSQVRHPYGDFRVHITLSQGAVEGSQDKSDAGVRQMLHVNRRTLEIRV